MKTKLFLLVCALAFFAPGSQAAILRVNNSNGTSPGYTTIQAAVDAASTGDYIYIEGGAYDGFTVNKKVYIYGTCFETSTNASIETTPPVTQITGVVTFTSGSEGSILTGCNLWISQKVLNMQASDILVTRCKLYQVSFKTMSSNSKLTVNNAVFEDDIINSFNINRTYNYDTIYVTNVAVSNSVIEGTLSLRTDTYQSFNGVFDQCVFLYLSGSNSPCTQYCTYTNSIFKEGSSNMYNYRYVMQKTGANNVNHCVFESTWTADATYQTGTDNVIGATDIFDVSSAGYELSSASEAKGVGNNAQDAGIYGGSNPFVPGGYPVLPTITKMYLPKQVTGTLNVDVKAKIIE